MAFNQQFKNLDDAEVYLKQNLSMILSVSPDTLDSFKISTPTFANAPLGDSSPLFVQAKNALNVNMRGMNEFNPDSTLTGNSTSYPTFSLTAYANFVKNALKALESPRGINFILSQTVLHFLNPTLGQGKIFNPIAGVVGPPPFLGGFTTDSLDHPAADNGLISQTIQEDKLKKLYDGNVVDIKTGIVDYDLDGPKLRMHDGSTLDQKAKQLNIFTQETPTTNFKDIDPYDGTNVKIEANILRVPQISPDYEQLFNKNKTGPGFTDGGKGFQGFVPKQNISDLGEDYIKAVRNMTLLDTYFRLDDAEKGYLIGNEGTQDAVFRDTETYMPFYFQDLRKPQHLIYFRAFLINFEESLSPTWTTENFYGRTDPVGIYQNTSRTFNISFKIVSFSQAGFSTMWKKINNLSKMVLPQTKDGAFFASPTIRLRVGDVCADGAGRGLPGYINSALNFNYSDKTWETHPYLIQAAKELGRAPMSVDCNFSFQVIHEQNPVVDENYNFDTTYFRRIGKIPDTQNAATTNQNQQGNTDQTSLSNNQSTTLTGPR